MNNCSMAVILTDFESADAENNVKDKIQDGVHKIMFSSLVSMLKF